MKKKELLSKILEAVESIADNQHRPKGYEYTHKEERDKVIAHITRHDVYFEPSEEVKKRREEYLVKMMQEDENDGIYQKKPFPKYWWTYTEGLPDFIKDWIFNNQDHHFDINEWLCISKMEDKDSIVGINQKCGEYVTHQQIIDHYGLKEKGQPEKTYTKEQVLKKIEKYCYLQGDKEGIIDWIEENM